MQVAGEYSEWYAGFKRVASASAALQPEDSDRGNEFLMMIRKDW